MAAAAQRAPVGAQASPAPPAAPAVAEAHPSHRHSHGEEQSHGGTDDVAQLILHHLRDGRAWSAPLHPAFGVLREPRCPILDGFIPWDPPPHIPAHL